MSKFADTDIIRIEKARNPRDLNGMALAWLCIRDGMTVAEYDKLKRRMMPDCKKSPRSSLQWMVRLRNITVTPASQR